MTPASNCDIGYAAVAGQAINDFLFIIIYIVPEMPNRLADEAGLSLQASTLYADNIVTTFEIYWKFDSHGPDQVRSDEYDSILFQLKV